MILGARFKEETTNESMSTQAFRASLMECSYCTSVWPNYLEIIKMPVLHSERYDNGNSVCMHV
jgi:hypothetical protein